MCFRRDPLHVLEGAGGAEPVGRRIGPDRIRRLQRPDAERRQPAQQQQEHRPGTPRRRAAESRHARTLGDW
jgi:hypothetical protein